MHDNNIGNLYMNPHALPHAVKIIKPYVLHGTNHMWLFIIYESDVKISCEIWITCKYHVKRNESYKKNSQVKIN